MIVVYVSDDTGQEVDVEALYAEIATDAAKRDATGWRIGSMAGLPERHVRNDIVHRGLRPDPEQARAAVGAVVRTNEWLDELLHVSV